MDHGDWGTHGGTPAEVLIPFHGCARRNVGIFYRQEPSGAVLGLGFPCLLCCLAGLDCFPGGRFCHTAPIANPKCAQEHRPMELPPRLVFAPCCGIQHVRTDRSAIASALHCLDAVLAARYTALSPRAQIIAVHLTTRR